MNLATIRLAAAMVAITGTAAQAQDTGLQWQLRNCENVYARPLAGCSKIVSKTNSGWYSPAGCTASYQAQKDTCIKQAYARDASIRASDQRSADYQARMKAERVQYTADYEARMKAQQAQRFPQRSPSRGSAPQDYPPQQQGAPASPLADDNPFHAPR